MKPEVKKIPERAEERRRKKKRRRRSQRRRLRSPGKGKVTPGAKRFLT